MSDCITIEPGATPSFEEISIANFLIAKNFTDHIHFIKASKTQGVRTPDIKMNDLQWEMKTPIGKGTHTIKRAFENALGQSENIIFDLRCSKLPDQANVPKLEKEFHDIKKVKRLLIITKTKKLLEFYR